MLVARVPCESLSVALSRRRSWHRCTVAFGVEVGLQLTSEHHKLGCAIARATVASPLHIIRPAAPSGAMTVSTHQRSTASLMFAPLSSRDERGAHHLTRCISCAWRASGSGSHRPAARQAAVCRCQPSTSSRPLGSENTKRVEQAHVATPVVIAAQLIYTYQFMFPQTL